jgi:hypothetical protein
MSRNSQLIQSNRNNNTSPINNNNLAIVLEVILTDANRNLKKKYLNANNLNELSTEDIGSIIARPISDSVSRDLSKFPIIRPLNHHDTDYPIVGETVEIIYVANSSGGDGYYRRISNLDINKGNATLDVDLKTYPLEDRGTGKNTNEYREISNTGTSNASSNNQNRKTNFGTYFQPQQINRLRPYEGDKIIQSRFGQSIRFSGYNNDNNVFSPTIIIRNRQGNTTFKYNDIIEEDVNVDGTVIVIGSGEYQSNFSATTSIKPTKFTDYPNQLTGNQLIVNSDRILLSAKTGNMIFHSKGNYGFISDGKFSIDGGLGADLDFGGDVNITTTRTNSNISLSSGTGRLFLNTSNRGQSPNTGQTEPLVRGNTLKEILETMIDLINSQVYRTPSGPTAVGPENRAQFNALKRKLSEMLSTLNYTE